MCGLTAGVRDSGSSSMCCYMSGTFRESIVTGTLSGIMGGASVPSSWRLWQQQHVWCSNRHTQVMGWLWHAKDASAAVLQLQRPVMVVMFEVCLCDSCHGAGGCVEDLYFLVNRNLHTWSSPSLRLPGTAAPGAHLQALNGMHRHALWFYHPAGGAM